MNDDRLNPYLEAYIRDHLSPKKKERELISARYEQIRGFLPAGSQVFQSGSYARFTSTTPVNDLDLIYVLPKSTILSNSQATSLDPSEVLSTLAEHLQGKYDSVGEPVRVEHQSHSIGVYWGGDDEFSIDLVPSQPLEERNEFKDPLYLVPEVERLPRKKRRRFYESKRHIGWLKSDPRGYIEAAKRLNDHNGAYRKAAKLLKAWRRSCKRNYPLLRLKSFHVELMVARLFESNQDLTTLECVHLFFQGLPALIQRPAFPDRANRNVFIDAYLSEVSRYDKTEIAALCGLALRHLRACSEAEQDRINECIGQLVSARDFGEQFISDQQYEFADDLISLPVRGAVEPKEPGGYRGYYLHEKENKVEGVGRRIHFELSGKADLKAFPQVLLKWKVKNRIVDYVNQHSRGEITLDRTRCDPESTAYNGQHFVDCYALAGAKCVGFGRQYVHIVGI